ENWLDPRGVTPDWFTPNNVRTTIARLDPRTSNIAFDWPLRRQERGERYVTLLTPLVWYSRPGGPICAVRARSHYVGLLDQLELAIGGSVKVLANGRDRPVGSPPGTGASPKSSRWQGWLVRENPILPGATRPMDGLSYGGWRVDGIWRVDARTEWYVRQPAAGARRARMSMAATGTYPYDRNFYDPERWSGRSATDLTIGVDLRPADEQGMRVRASLTGGYAVGGGREDEPYARGEASASMLRRSPTGHLVHFIRVFVGGDIDAPVERAVYASALSPT